MGNPVVHFEFMSQDPAKVAAFYEQLFGWKIKHMPELNYRLVETGGEGGINGGIMQSPHGTPFVTLYVQVDDVQAYLDKATGLGGAVIMPPTDMEGVGKIACFTDPDGNVVGLYKPVANGSSS
jgi:uncharacterized protein